MKRHILIFSLVIFSLFSCKKETVEPDREIKYEVKIADQNICYYWSDVDGAVRKKYGSSGGLLTLSHKLSKGANYYIKVEYRGTYKPEYDYQVNVYSNGTRIDGIKTAFHIKRVGQGDSISSDNIVKYEFVTITGTVQ